MWHYQEGATLSWRKKQFLLIFYGRVDVFWLFGFNDTSRTSFLRYSHFQIVKFKPRQRAFCWSIVCFSTSNGSFRILIWKYVRFRLLHPVYCFNHQLMEITIPLSLSGKSLVNCHKGNSHKFNLQIRGNRTNGNWVIWGL